MKKFNVLFLDEVDAFLENLDEKAKEKILFNIWKAKKVLDPELFKKLKDEIWEFRTLYQKKQYRLLAFWDKRDKKNTLVICANGFIKKTQKTPEKEIEKVKNIMQEYFNNF